MIDATFYKKVKVLLDKLDLVFEQDWAATKQNLDPNVIQHFIDPEATFLEPEGLDSNVEWKSRDELLAAYRSVVVAIMKLENSGKLRSAPVAAQPAQSLTSPQARPAQPATAPQQGLSQHSETVTVYPVDSNQSLADRTSAPGGQELPARDAAAIAAMAAAEISTPTAPVSTPAPAESVAPANQAATAAPTSASPTPTAPMGMPKPKPGSGPQGFPRMVSAKITGLEPIKPVKPASSSVSEQTAAEKEKAALAANTGKVLFSSDDGKEAEKEVRDKFAHLLQGVKSETIRDFILAEGTHTGTGKPSMIIYIPDKIWLEFAFDFAEGQRILNKYPQRDPELIEFMRSSGHKNK